MITKRNLNEKSACVWLSNCYVQKLSQSDTRWDEIGKTKCVFISLIGGKKIRSYFRIPELSELWDQLVIFSGIKIVVACWPHPTDGIAVDGCFPLVCGPNPSSFCYVLKLTHSDSRLDEIVKTNFVFTSIVLSVIRKRNWWVAKKHKILLSYSWVVSKPP